MNVEIMKNFRIKMKVPGAINFVKEVISSNYPHLETKMYIYTYEFENQSFKYAGVRDSNRKYLISYFILQELTNKTYFALLVGNSRLFHIF